MNDDDLQKIRSAINAVISSQGTLFDLVMAVASQAAGREPISPVVTRSLQRSLDALEQAVRAIDALDVTA